MSRRATVADTGRRAAPEVHIPRGAAGDGVADDSAAIQRTLDLVGELPNGGTVFLPAGVYYLGTSLSVASNTMVLGAGIGRTVLRPASPLAAVVVDSTTMISSIGAVGKTGVVFESFTVDNATNSVTANCVVMMPSSVVANDFQGDPCTDCTVRDVEVIGYRAHEYLIWSLRGERIKVIDCRADGRCADFSTAVDHNAIEIYGGSDVVITGNHIRAFGGTGVGIGSANPTVLQTSCAGMVVANNVIYDCGSGVVLYSSTANPTAQDISDVVVSGNTIRGCHTTGVWVYLGYDGPVLEGVKILGNAIANCPIGVSLDSSFATRTHDIEVASNTLRDCTHATLGAIYATKMTGLHVHDNVVIRPTNQGMRLITCADSRFNRNEIRDAGAEAIRCDALADCQVNENRIDGCGATAIYGGSSPARTSFDGNYVRGTPAGNLCILIAATASFCTANDNRIYRDIAPTASVDIAITGDGCVMDGNLYLTPTNASRKKFQHTGTGTNLNIGEATPAAAATSIAVTNSQVVAGSRIDVEQTAGAPLAHRVTTAAGSFTITLAAAAVGDEVYKWRIVQQGVLA